MFRKWLGLRGVPVGSEGMNRLVRFFPFGAKRTGRERLRAMLECTPARLAYINPDFRYEYANTAYRSWFHLSPAELQGKEVREVIGQSAWDAIGRHISTALSGKPSSLEEELPYRGLGSRWVRINYAPDIDPSGNIRGAIEHVCCFEQSKFAERVSRQGQTDLQRAQSLSHTGSWRLYAPENKIDWSDETHLIFGVPRGTHVSYDIFLSCVHPADRLYVDQRWQAALKGEKYDIEHRIVVKSGVKWVRERAELEYGADGRLLGAFGTVEDITDRKLAEEALKGRDAFLRQVIDAAPSMIFVKDWEGRFVLCNESLAACYGSPVKQVLGKTDAAFNANLEELEHFRNDDREVMSLRKEKHIPEEQVTNASGETRWFSTVKVPLLNDDGTCNKVLGVATDITARKLAEEALREADRKKDEFLAMLAHELRNPMAAISAAATLLSLPDLPKDESDYAVGVLRQRVGQLARLVDDLLDVSRIVRGKIELQLENIDLSAIINAAAEATRGFFEEKQHSLQIKIDQPLPVRGDPVRLEEVIHNLLSNAARYSPERGRIEVATSVSGGVVSVRITDNGIGMSPEILPRIFDMFGQADGSYHRSTGGLGVGLTIVKKLVEMHGGSVSARSAGPGQGSEFEVKLPMAEEARPGGLAQHAASDAPSLRILVAEDHRDTAVMTASLLKRKGHEVELEFDGPSAVRHALETRPDVILLDLGLPGMDGFEVAEALRGSGLAKTLIVAVSGYGQARDLDRCKNAGMDCHLLKPIDYTQLSAILSARQRSEHGLGAAVGQSQ